MFKLNYSKLSGNVMGSNKASIYGTGSSAYMLPTNYESKLLDDMIGSNNKLTLNSLYREIYLYDSVSGPAVDLMSTLPWSDCVITGISDKSVIRIYEDSLSELNIHSLMIQLSVSYLVLGSVIGSLIFDEGKGIFTDLSIHDPDICEIMPIPLKGYDPKIDLKVSAEMKKFLRSKDPRDKEALSEIPNELFLALLKKEKIQLEPLNTIYLSRSNVPGIHSLSYYTRILPIWLIEKALMRGTIIGAWRRQRAITHITCLTGDTLIIVNGSKVRIDSLCSKEGMSKGDYKEVNFKTRGKNGKTINIIRWVYNGMDFVKEITTKSGYNIQATDTHKFLVSKNYIKWEEVQNLNIGDLLVVDPYLNPSSTLNSLDPIVSIIPIPYKVDVYDITVTDKENEHAFVGNGFIVKNCGTDEWEPTDEQLDNITGMFINADQDPMGAVLTTRAGIDVQEHKCLTGDTLISTDKGLGRIDSLVSHNPDKLEPGTQFDLYIKIEGLYETYQFTKYWIYQGKKEIIQLTSISGKILNCTENHKLLSMDKDGNISLTEAINCLGKSICISSGINVNITNRYKFEKVESITKAGIQHVYDLSMTGTPIFVANSIVVKNSGSDFWRVSDEWDVFSSAKMRALGINDDFLCLSSDTLISTENGLIPIGKICSRKGLKKDSGIDINLSIKGIKGKEVKATKWWYRGKNEVMEVTSNLGYNFKATPKHLIRVLSKGLEPIWKEVKDLTFDDTIFIDIKGENIVNRKLSLNLEFIEIDNSNLKIFKPEFMTPDLSYLVGLILSNGQVYNNHIRFESSDENLIFKYTLLIKSIFNLDCIIEHSRLKERLNPDNFTVHLESEQISKWFIYLGFDIPFNKRHDNCFKRCHLRTIPWSILQADSESQISFIAGFIDGDGSVNKKEGAINLTFYSNSIKVLNQIRVILINLGILSYSMPDYSNHLKVTDYSNHLKVTGTFGNKLYLKIQKYLCSVKSQYTIYDLQDRTIGIPVKYINELLRERHIKQEVNVGGWFENDEGETVLIKKWEIRTFDFLDDVVGNKEAKNLLYSSYEEGKYNDLISLLEQVSPSLTKKLVSLFEIKYVFDNIRSIVKLGKKHLYDLTIESEKAPAFIANGIVVHNSGSANFATAEVSLSTFIETQKAFRDFMTTNIIYNKIFLLLSKYHEIRKITPAQLDHRVRINGSDENTLITAKKNLSSFNKYLIPTVHWMKDLSPKMDSSYIETLSTVADKGLPIPLALYASAAGLNINNLLNSLGEDVEYRKKIGEYQKSLKEAIPQEENSEMEGSAFKDIPRESILTPNQADRLLDENYGKLKHLT